MQVKIYQFTQHSLTVSNARLTNPTHHETRKTLADIPLFETRFNSKLNINSFFLFFIYSTRKYDFNRILIFVDLFLFSHILTYFEIFKYEIAKFVQNRNYHTISTKLITKLYYKQYKNFISTKLLNLFLFSSPSSLFLL